MKHLLLVPLFFFATLTANAEYYGNNKLTPLIKNGEPVIHLPGGHRFEGDNLILSDIHGRNIKDSKEPFTIQSEYEPETATNDVKARQYDPTIARFTSPDPIRQSASPYTYTDNDPINYVDTDGNVRYSLWLYSNFGVTINDGMTPGEPNVPSLRGQVRDMTRAIEVSKLTKPLKRMS